MTTTRTFCDFCSVEFTSNYWDNQPCSIILKLGVPAQSFESREAKHVCNQCRHSIVKYWDALVKKGEQP